MKDERATVQKLLSQKAEAAEANILQRLSWFIVVPYKVNKPLDEIFSLEYKDVFKK